MSWCRAFHSLCLLIFTATHNTKTTCQKWYCRTQFIRPPTQIYTTYRTNIWKNADYTLKLAETYNYVADPEDIKCKLLIETLCLTNMVWIWRESNVGNGLCPARVCIRSVCFSLTSTIRKLVKTDAVEHSSYIYRHKVTPHRTNLCKYRLYTQFGGNKQ